MLFAAGALGLTGVLAGTFGAHGLKGVLTPQLQETFEIGVQYHLIHAVACLALNVVKGATPTCRWITNAAWFWTVGVVIFSGSLYALALTSKHWLGWITPIGGFAFLLGWGCVCLAAIPFRTSQSQATADR